MQQDRFHPLIRAIGALALSAAGLLLAACGGRADWGDGQQTTIRPETDSTRVIQDIYTAVTYIDIAIFVVVAALLFWAVFRYRAKPGQEAEIPKQVHGNPVLELIWTIIPAIILIFIAVPTWQGIFRAAQPPSEGAFTVEAVGHQWWWEFKYKEQEILTANEMVIPVGRPVVVDTNSVDVIHAFWVPKLSGKIDSLPGHTNTLWFTPEKPGLYYGQCAEFCGTSHANMRFRVRVVTPDEFDAWVAEQKQPPKPQTSDAEAGAQLFVSKGCIACHAISGVPIAVGILGPNLTNLASRSSLAAGIMENTPDNLVDWLRDAQKIKPGALMGVPGPDGKYQPLFAGARLTEEEAGQLAAYLLSEPGAAAPAPAAAASAPSMAGQPTAAGPSANDLFQQRICIACHVIPGVPGAVGTVGPSLAGLMGRPTMVAGKLETNEANLRKWLANPKAIKPDTLMVTPPLSDADIDTMVGFLLELK